MCAHSACHGDSSVPAVCTKVLVRSAQHRKQSWPGMGLAGRAGPVHSAQLNALCAMYLALAQTSPTAANLNLALQGTSYQGVQLHNRHQSINKGDKEQSSDANFPKPQAMKAKATIHRLCSYSRPARAVGHHHPQPSGKLRRRKEAVRGRQAVLWMKM